MSYFLLYSDGPRPEEALKPATQFLTNADILAHNGYVSFLLVANKDFFLLF